MQPVLGKGGRMKDAPTLGAFDPYPAEKITKTTASFPRRPWTYWREYETPSAGLGMSGDPPGKAGPRRPGRGTSGPLCLPWISGSRCMDG